MVTQAPEPKRLPLRLSGRDGNAFSILGRAAETLRRAGRAGDVARYQAEATAGSYEDLLAVTARWFDVR